MNKPRFLFVQQYHFLTATGGTEIQCWMLATELARRGWDVHYASEMNHVPQPNPLEGVTLHGLPENPSYFSCNRAEMRTLLRDLRPDVVLNQVIDLYTAHSMSFAPPHALKIYFNSLDNDGLLWPVLLDRRKAMPLPLFLKRFPVYFFVRVAALRGLHKADLVLTQHKQQVEQFRQAGIESIILRNAHPPLPDSDVQTHNGPPTIVWVSSIKGRKRPELFIELAKRCQDLPAKFVMVGAYQEPHYQSIVENAVQTLRNFEYRGFIPFARVGEQFKQAHLFISTSLSEGFASTFVQSWMYGVPVISLDVDPENILKEKGLGICASSLDEMEHAIRSLLDDPARRREIGARARAFAQQEFDLHKVVDKLEALLKERGVRLP
jgi:glycosyltransferase involved in cell wall biosynthesis